MSDQFEAMQEAGENEAAREMSDQFEAMQEESDRRRGEGLQLTNVQISAESGEPNSLMSESGSGSAPEAAELLAYEIQKKVIQHFQSSIHPEREKAVLAEKELRAEVEKISKLNRDQHAVIQTNMNKALSNQTKAYMHHERIRWVEAHVKKKNKLYLHLLLIRSGVEPNPGPYGFEDVLTCDSSSDDEEFKAVSVSTFVQPSLPDSFLDQEQKIVNKKRGGVRPGAGRGGRSRSLSSDSATEEIKCICGKSYARANALNKHQLKCTDFLQCSLPETSKRGASPSPMRTPRSSKSKLLRPSQLTPKPQSIMPDKYGGGDCQTLHVLQAELAGGCGGGYYRTGPAGGYGRGEHQVEFQAGTDGGYGEGVYHNQADLQAGPAGGDYQAELQAGAAEGYDLRSLRVSLDKVVIREDKSSDRFLQSKIHF